MSNKELLHKLQELHHELASINNDLESLQEIDTETLQALGTLVCDVSQIVDQASEVGDDHQTVVPPQNELLDRIHRFENSHPRVTSFLSQLTDLLAMMGI